MARPAAWKRRPNSCADSAKVSRRCRVKPRSPHGAALPRADPPTAAGRQLPPRQSARGRMPGPVSDRGCGPADGSGRRQWRQDRTSGITGDGGELLLEKLPPARAGADQQMRRRQTCCKRRRSSAKVATSGRKYDPCQVTVAWSRPPSNRRASNRSKPRSGRASTISKASLKPSCNISCSNAVMAKRTMGNKRCHPFPILRREKAVPMMDHHTFSTPTGLWLRRPPYCRSCPVRWLM